MTRRGETHITVNGITSAGERGTAPHVVGRGGVARDRSAGCMQSRAPSAWSDAAVRNAMARCPPRLYVVT